MDLFLNTSDIANSVDNLKSKVSEIQASISNVEIAINPLRNFRSPRIARDLETWDTVRANLMRTMEELLEASRELTRAAEANEAANR